MSLTVGCAAFNDFDGVYFSVQALRMYHRDFVDEIIVVDNFPQPDHPESVRLKDFCKKAGARYISMPNKTGTTQPRQRIFDEATKEWVMVIDSHVLLENGVLEKLARDIRACPQDDLYSGPMQYDHLDGGPSHFGNEWRGQMWGVWRTAWKHPNGMIVDVSPTIDGLCEFRMVMSGKVVKVNSDMGPIPFAGHEKVLRALGYKLPRKPFEIPGQGLGCFLARRESWLGFNPHFRNFGGEEMYIHEKYRKAGRHCICLPFLKWGHRFGNNGRNIAVTRYSKVRNYVLGHQELGLPLDAVYNHFVNCAFPEEGAIMHLWREHDVNVETFNRIIEKGLEVTPEMLDKLHTEFKMPESEWEYLLANPIEHELPPNLSTVKLQLDGKLTKEGVFTSFCLNPRDLDKHLPGLKGLADNCQTVVEFSKRRESFAAFVASDAKKVISHNWEMEDPVCKKLLELEEDKDRITLTGMRSDAFQSIEDCDMLFIDNIHMRKVVSDELKKFAPNVKHYIVMHDTALHGKRGEDNDFGLVYAIRDFIEFTPQWFVAHHTEEQYGLTVLSCQEQDRPAAPIIIWPIGRGPGTELKKLLKSLGISNDANCDCNGKADHMDAWGVEGCKKNRDQVIKWMKDGQGRWGWTSKLSAFAVGSAILSGLAFRLNPLDPISSLVDIAIKNASEVK